MDLNDTTHPDLSYDGCGINGPDQYRTRIATFTDKRGPVAEKYGPLFAAAPEMLVALMEALHEVCCLNMATPKEAPARNEALQKTLRTIIAKAEGKS